MRGYDVIARPTFNLNTDGFAQDYWDKAFKGAVLEEGFTGSGKEEIIGRMKLFGAGARGEIYVAWGKGGSMYLLPKIGTARYTFSTRRRANSTLNITLITSKTA